MCERVATNVRRAWPNGWHGAVILVLGHLIAFPPGIPAEEPDSQRIEGMIEAVESPTSVLVRTPDRLITVDVTALWGVTAALAPEQNIVAIGTMEPNADTFRARRLESPARR